MTTTGQRFEHRETEPLERGRDHQGSRRREDGGQVSPWSRRLHGRGRVLAGETVGRQVLPEAS